MLLSVKRILVGVLVFIGVIVAGSPSAFAEAQKKPLFMSYEQRLLMSYLLAGAGESQEKQVEVAQRFETSLKKYLAKEPQEIRVKSFTEFLAAYQGPWPNSYSLESDLDWIERSELRGPVIIKAETAALQGQIDGFIRRQNEELYKASSPEALKVVGQVATLNGFKKLSPKGLLDGRQKREWILEGFGLATEMLQSQLAEIQKTGAEIAETGKLNQTNESLKLFLTIAFKEYFGRLSLDTKKQIISQIMGGNLNLQPMQKFELMILSSGPQFQKLLQIVAREAGVSQDLLTIFKRLESKTQPIPDVVVKELFEAERETYRWRSYELSPLGTGTMAQVHRGIVDTPQGEREVVIRFLKPEIETRVNEDYRILSELAPLIDSNPEIRKLGFPKLGPLVQDLNKTVRDELDLKSTIARQVRGREVYTQELFLAGKGYKNVIQVSVPEVILPEAKSELHVQELVSGTKLDKLAAEYVDEVPELKQKIVEQIAGMWLEEVIFKSGFYHSDLHQGNFMVDLTEPAIKVNILDFGMGGTISRETQSNFLVLGAGLELLNPQVIARAFLNLSDKTKTQISETQFTALVAARVQEIKSGKVERQTLEKWISWSMDQGIKFPYEFVSLNRGMVILDRMLQEAKSPYTTTDISKKVARNNVKAVLSALRGKGNISWVELAKLGWVSMTSAPQSRPEEVPAKPVRALRCQAVHL